MKTKPFIVIIALLLLSFELPDEKIVVYTIGDSTMANKPAGVYPETGWAQVLSRFFDTSVEVRNRAVNGRSTKSFIVEGRWKAITDSLKPGDYVFIQFGHNDQKEKDSSRYTNPYTSYRSNLVKYITETLSKGAIPVLLTPIVRRNFNEYGALIDTHGAYPEVMRSVAREMQVILIDLQMLTEEMVIREGVEGSKALYLHVKPGDVNFPGGKEDNTHLSEKGAGRVAGMVVQALQELPVSLSKHIRQE